MGRISEIEKRVLSENAKNRNRSADLSTYELDILRNGVVLLEGKRCRGRWATSRVRRNLRKLSFGTVGVDRTRTITAEDGSIID